MDGNAKSLCAMNMSHTRWVGNDSISHKRLSVTWPITRFKAGFPTSFDYPPHLPTAPLDGSIPHSVEIGEKPRVLYHEIHEFLRIPPYVKKLQTSIKNKITKGQVGGQSNTMAVCFQLLSQCNKWLNIPARSNDLDDNVQMQRKILPFPIRNWFHTIQFADLS